MVLARFARAASLYSFGAFVPAAANLFLLPVFAAYLSPGDFGAFQKYVMITTLVIAISRLGLPGSITRFYIDFETEKSKKSFIKTILVSTFFLSIVFSLLTFLIFRTFYDVSPAAYDFMFFLALSLAGVCVKSFYDVLVKVYQITENVKKITIFSLVLFSINAVTKFILVIQFNYGFEALVYAELLTNTASLLLAIWFLRSLLGASISQKYLNASLVYGFPVSIHHVSSWVVSYSSALLVAYCFDEYLLGIFAIAIKLFLPGSFVIDAMANAYSPVYYKLRKKGHSAVEEIEMLNHGFISMSLWSCAAMIWGTKLCVYYLFNEEYLPILDFISFICLSMFFNGLYRITVAEVFYLKKTSIVPKITLITGVVVLSSGYLLISNFGLIGGGISILLSSIIQYLMVSFYTKDFQVLSISKRSWALIFMIFLTVFAEIVAVNVYELDVLVIISFQFCASLAYLGYATMPALRRRKQ